MTRQEFIEYFKTKHNNYFSDYYNTIHFEYYLKEYDSTEMLGLMFINSKLDDIYKELNINNGYYLKKGEVDLYFDHDFAEEYPDEDRCRYDSKLHLNFLYDKLLDNNSIQSNNDIILYRIESSDGSGLYDGIGFNILSSGDENAQPGPENDVLFYNIFSHDRRIDHQYKKNWKFSFGSKEQLRNWLSDVKVFDELKKHNFKVNQLIVNSNHCIIGEFQAIYRDSGVKKSDIFDLNILDDLFYNKKAKKTPSI